MERITWTDERLNDLANRMDAGFVRVDADMRDLRGDIAALRTELRSEFRSEIGSLRNSMNRVGGGLIVTLIGVFATMLARGL